MSATLTITCGEFRIADGRIAFEGGNVDVRNFGALICDWSAFVGWIGEFPCGVVYKVFVGRKQFDHQAEVPVKESTNELNLKWQFRNTMIRLMGVDINLSNIWIIWE